MPVAATRRRLASIVALLAVLCLSLGGTRLAAAEPVRVFLVGNKQRVLDATTVATFRAKMFALVDASQRGPGLVQDGVDDVASHLAPHDPSAPALAVVHFPESVGLIAGLAGSRGVAAREATSATGAFAALLGPYADPIAYYTDVYPELAAQPIRGLVVGLTDVLYRAVYETFRDMAVEYGIWVSVSFDAAPARRVDASEDPALVERLRDPDEPERPYAYVATSPLPRNFVFLFDPQGNLMVPDGDGGLLRAPGETGGELPGSVAKAYLTPIEQTLDKPGGGLSLASASVRDLDVLDTPVGAIGVVISKDAWMPDVNERFDLKGASMLLQSEAFSSWAYDLTEWAPDVFKSGGYANLQNRGGFLYNLAPSLTGNLFDVTFDGQSAILVKRRSKAPAGARTPDNAFIGQLADRGFVRLAPWIVPDPPTEAPGALASRRADLVSFGANLLPASGVTCPDSLAVGSCENGYREAVIFTDLDVPPSPAGGDGVPVPVDRTRRTTSFGANRAVAASAVGRQRHPRVAARGRRVAVVWDDTRAGGQPAVWMSLSSDAGASFAPPVKVSDAPAGAAAELDPDVALSDGELVVAWQAFEHGGNDDAAQIRLARFTPDGVKRGRDVRVDGGETDAGRWQPALALLPDGAPVVAWIDERDQGPDGVALEHVYAARFATATGAFAPAVRVDDGTPVPLAASLDNRWSPTILAVGDTVHVAWADFRDYNWDVYAARSDDGGRSFAASQRVNGFPDFERISDAPALAAGRGSDVRLAWTDVRAREPDGNLFTARSSDGGRTWQTDRQLDLSRRGFDADRDRPSLQHAVTLAKAGERGFAAWQDDRAGNQDILFAALDDTRGGAAIREERVDDTGDGPSNQYRPHLAVAGDGSAARCVLVWEDDRDGRMQIYAAARACVPSRTPTLPLR